MKDVTFREGDCLQILYEGQVRNLVVRYYLEGNVLCLGCYFGELNKYINISQLNIICVSYRHEEEQ